MSNIIRIEKREKFTVISRALLEDKNLHWSTRGILAYLLCKPDNWILRVTDLKNQGNLGRDAIYKRLKNAIEYGYITRIDHRDDKGRVTGVEYIVREKPRVLLTENPETDNQETRKPDTVNTDINKDEVVTNTKNITTTTTTTLTDSGGSYVFHKKLTPLQKQEISKLLKPLDFEHAQEVLYELSGYVDKNLMQKDAVSLLQGFVRKAEQGEFSLRLGIKYKESANKVREIKIANKKSIENAPKLKPCDLDNPLVKKLMNIKSTSRKCD